MTDMKKIVDEVLGKAMTKEIWSGDYRYVLPLTLQNFDLEAILPAIFYMFRFGDRRGKGRFQETFAEAPPKTSTEGKKTPKKQWAATIENVGRKLSTRPELDGFDGECEQAILGDLLLSFNLENRNNALGRKEPVARVLPSHYMASWVDLPDAVVNLRFVPEMIVAMLADQEGDKVKTTPENENKPPWFPVATNMDQNVMLQPFYTGVFQEAIPYNDLSTDRFNEEVESVGIDQLLMIRMAQELEEPPLKIHTQKDRSISNQRPIAEKASKEFSRSLRRFVRHYAPFVPRTTFVEMLESCLSVGLTTILSGTIEMLIDWENTGKLPDPTAQHSSPILVDCSNGVNAELRNSAEQSADEFVRRLERLPVILMILRILDYSVRFDPALKKTFDGLQNTPYATSRINLLGETYLKENEKSHGIHYNIGSKAMQMAELLRENATEVDQFAEAVKILQDDVIYGNAVTRLAVGLMTLWGKKPREHIMKLLDSSLMIGRPNGLARKRKVQRQSEGNNARDIRSLVLTDPVLDYLVHSHLLHKDVCVPLSFDDFLGELRDRYGFHVDTPPPGWPVSNDLLQENRRVLERRLRDLGLLIGVNDAESMKMLKPRFVTK